MATPPRVRQRSLQLFVCIPSLEFKVRRDRRNHKKREEMERTKKANRRKDGTTAGIVPLTSLRPAVSRANMREVHRSEERGEREVDRTKGGNKAKKKRERHIGKDEANTGTHGHT